MHFLYKIKSFCVIRSPPTVYALIHLKLVYAPTHIEVSSELPTHMSILLYQLLILKKKAYTFFTLVTSIIIHITRYTTYKYLLHWIHTFFYQQKVGRLISMLKWLHYGLYRFIVNTFTCYRHKVYLFSYQFLTLHVIEVTNSKHT